ncbi:MAG TPA: NB-ARC domain-containing protein [Ardenticatenaceae bacterium]|nr:NB-ARC domain-containing protein [Ardenticatenaceae bacterium]
MTAAPSGADASLSEVRARDIIIAGRDVYLSAGEQRPSLFVGVPSMPVHFVGREALVASLVARLTSGQAGAVAVQGLPGVGKTTLAVALAHHRGLLEHFRDGILWASLGPRGDILAALATWGQALGVDVTELASAAERSQAVKDAVGQRHLLLVVDDVWDKEAAGWLRCGGPNCRHLLTTRDQGIARAFAGVGQAIAAPPLEESPAVALLRALAPEAFAVDEAAARELALATGGLPLALELLGGFLAAPENSVFSELASEALAEMRDPARRLELATRRLGALASPEVTLRETIELSLDGLTD